MSASVRHPSEVDMKSVVSARACALLVTLLCASATNAGDLRDFFDPGNRIVGLWSTEALIGPCNAAPTTPIRNTLLFHAGGTVVENPRFAPNGIVSPAGLYQRGQALGTWNYDPFSRKFFVHLRFDNYVDGVWNGYSTVDREITLTKRGMHGSGPIRSARYRVDGTLLSEVCGEAVSLPL
jgi:hypothetical protein